MAVRRRRTRTRVLVAALVAGGYLSFVLVVLRETLRSLAPPGGFDGLNHLTLTVVTLPWSVPVFLAASAWPAVLGDHVVLAWALAGGGVANAVLAYRLVSRVGRAAGG